MKKNRQIKDKMSSKRLLRVGHKTFTPKNCYCHIYHKNLFKIIHLSLIGHLLEQIQYIATGTRATGECLTILSCRNTSGRWMGPS